MRHTRDRVEGSNPFPLLQKSMRLAAPVGYPAGASRPQKTRLARGTTISLSAFLHVAFGNGGDHVAGAAHEEFG
jgi:hypothetical protein